MDLVVLGVNHRTAPLEVRERLDFSKYPREDYLSKLAGQSSVRSGMVLSTCNRVEVYAMGNNAERLLTDADEFLRIFHGLRKGEIESFLYSKSNMDAVRHLFRVAASLDSMIVGEPQILGQVKEAYFASSAASLVDPIFDRLLRKTFSVAKRVRNETNIAEQAVSISYAAVELATHIFGRLEGKKVMILGGGEMAELAARHFSKENVGKIYFANRTYESSVELAKEFNGIPIPIDQFSKDIFEVDILLVSTAAPHYMVHVGEVARALEMRKQEPMFFIDISVPRNVDPAINALENVYLYNIDDLQNVVANHKEARAQEAEKAEAIIELEIKRFYEAIERMKVGPMIESLQEKAETARQMELSRLSKRLKNVTAEEMAEIERATESLVRKILHDPIQFLKEDPNEMSQAERTVLFQSIFGLRKESEGEE